ncbi:MAG: exodeoxyribonuclease VII small subunit [Chloroflexota bacterium]
MTENLREGEQVDDLTFEDAFGRLEDTVARLEAGGISIEDMVVRFEEGMALVKLCYRRLDGARARVRLLAEEGFEGEDLDPENEPGDADPDVT